MGIGTDAVQGRRTRETNSQVYLRVKKILLYSGGIDSFITYQLLPGLIPVHFSFRNPSWEYELKLIRDVCPDAHVYRLPALDDDLYDDPTLECLRSEALLFLDTVSEEYADAVRQ